jgi:hypothetical protein
VGWAPRKLFLPFGPLSTSLLFLELAACLRLTGLGGSTETVIKRDIDVFRKDLGKIVTNLQEQGQW